MGVEREQGKEEEGGKEVEGKVDENKEERERLRRKEKKRERATGFAAVFSPQHTSLQPTWVHSPGNQTILTIISGSGSFTTGTLVFLYFFLFFS